MKKLTITQSANMAFVVQLLDDQDENEVLTGATDATIDVKEDSLATTSVFADTTNDTLTLDVASGTVSGVMDASGFPIGSLVGEVAVKIGTSWFHTDKFEVEVEPRVAAQI